MILALHGRQFRPCRDERHVLDTIQVFLGIVVVHVVTQHFELVPWAVVFEAVPMVSYIPDRPTRRGSLVIVR